MLPSRFYFDNTFWLGKQVKQQRLSDALSRKLYLASKARKATFDQQYKIMLKLEWFRLCATVIPTLVDVDFLDKVCIAIIEDSMALDIKHCLSKDDKFKAEKNLLYFKKHLSVLQKMTQLCILHFRHDFSTASYFRYKKSLEFLSKDF